MLAALCQKDRLRLSLTARGPLHHDTEINGTALKAHANEWALAMQPVIQGVRSLGFAKNIALAAELNRRGFATARGGTWAESTVRQLLTRLRHIRERGGR
jgi:hypothetical protein